MWILPWHIQQVPKNNQTHDFDKKAALSSLPISIYGTVILQF